MVANMISIAFLNNNASGGKTSLVYHTAWMFSELGQRVLVVDLDPQSNLSIMALDEGSLEKLWHDNDGHPQTLYGAVAPLFDGTGDIRQSHIEPLSEKLGLLVGDLALSRIENDLAEEWPRCLEGHERAFRLTTAFWRVIRDAAERHAADLVLIDVGPNLGAINRAALVASSHIVVPVAQNLLSIQGLKNLGPTLRQWRDTWQLALTKTPGVFQDTPQGQMVPIGYVLMQQKERLNRSTKNYAKLQEQMSNYLSSVLGEPNLIHRIRNYDSLMPMAMEAHKPMFGLTVTDGAIGAYQTNVQQCRDDFKVLCFEIARRVGCDIQETLNTRIENTHRIKI